MKKAIYPGSFDPPTLGHINLIERASKFCDILYVAIGKNSTKVKTLFNAEEKLELLTLSTKHLPNVEVCLFDGLLITLAQTLQTFYIIKGLRNYKDFEEEISQENLNKMLSPVETVYLFAEGKNTYIHSRLIKEIGMNGGDISPFVPKAILNRVQNRLKKLSE